VNRRTIYFIIKMDKIDGRTPYMTLRGQQRNMKYTTVDVHDPTDNKDV
jgi:hypothetical protein